MTQRPIVPVRTAVLVLVERSGAVLGALPEIGLSTPWWPDIGEAVEFVRRRDGVEVQVLRFLDAVSDGPSGGRVRYLAEVVGGLPAGLELAPAFADDAPEPRRAPYARPGGPAASLAWAHDALAAAGRRATGATQLRTWNLSSLHRLDTVDGPVWLKEVPWFFAHEPRVIRRLAELRRGMPPESRFAGSPTDSAHPGDGALPEVLAEADGRMLLAHVPGSDGHDAPLSVRRRIAAAAHGIHVAGLDRAAEWRSLGVPDRTAKTLPDRLLAVGRRLDRERRDGLDRFLDGFDVLAAELGATGLPDTLVHGDLHAGNTRAARGGPLTIIDWGDAALGLPSFDLHVLGVGLPGAERAVLAADFTRRWRADCPGSDPDRALALSAALQHWLLAAVYAEFLDRIEPAEHPFHAGDLLAAVDAAIAAQ
ncbi:aminoglycoside phosphotransferase family protein [Agromyces seonyuensis]|uniref:Phosphotransferase n=1 Tax=Agromyces seonyuensis TaxID=2662446 RepID=A0A6I4NZU3_9MICO|nr:aminoglycoside phosphotransferase family protein [Agromyces seonyuensis]MWB97299.1 phosphotransferase [Agromyces seonyuensis]